MADLPAVAAAATKVAAAAAAASAIAHITRLTPASAPPATALRTRRR